MNSVDEFVIGHDLALRNVARDVWHVLDIAQDRRYGDELRDRRVIARGDHLGAPAHVIDAIANRALEEAVRREFPENTLVLGEEGVGQTTIATPGNLMIAADPLDGTSLWRAQGTNWAVVLLLFELQGQSRKFLHGIIAYSSGRFHSINRAGWVKRGRLLNDPAGDQPVEGVSQTSSMNKVAMVAPKPKDLRELLRLTETSEFDSCYNQAGAPATWGFVEGDLSCLVELKETMPCDSAGLLFLTALGAIVVLTEPQMTRLTYPDMRQYFETANPVEKSIRPYFVVKLVDGDRGDPASAVRRLVSYYVRSSGPNPDAEDERIASIVSSLLTNTGPLGHRVFDRSKLPV